MAEIVIARSAAELDEARQLFREYAAGVAEPCCFASFEAELAGLPGDYAPPGGRLLLARERGGFVGCAALRRQDAASGEMKRLYVRESCRGTGLGRRLAEEILRAAREEGYARLLLDTLPKMRAAIALYESLGLRRIGPYAASPTPGAIFFALSLS